jgi:hypothetical protein
MTAAGQSDLKFSAQWLKQGEPDPVIEVVLL